MMVYYSLVYEGCQDGIFWSYVAQVAPKENGIFSKIFKTLPQTWPNKKWQFVQILVEPLSYAGGPRRRPTGNIFLS
jgi:hypothetical protein